MVSGLATMATKFTEIDHRHAPSLLSFLFLFAVVVVVAVHFFPTFSSSIRSGRTHTNDDDDDDDKFYARPRSAHRKSMTNLERETHSKIA